MRRALVISVCVLMAGAAAPAVAGGSEANTIEVAGPFAVGTPRGDALVAELEAAAPPGAAIAYYRYNEPAELIVRFQAGNPPDVIITVGTSLLHDVADGLKNLKKLRPKAERAQFMNRLRNQYGDYLIDDASKGRKLLGGAIGADIKSLVWYDAAAFSAGGYAIPKTFKQLVALSNAMVADGKTPWCNYIESSGATGWIGTDWVEDLLIGHKSGAFYDRWVKNNVAFTSKGVKQAFNRFKRMIDNEGYVFDRANIVTTSFLDNASAIERGDCLMHRQGRFFAAFLDSPGDFKTFFFPGTKGRKAAVGPATFVATSTLEPKVKQLLLAMLRPSFGEAALAQSRDWFMPNTRFDTANHPDAQAKKWANRIHKAILGDGYRQDASDQMPVVVTSAFWQGIVDLANGSKTIPQILNDIEASWP